MQTKLVKNLNRFVRFGNTMRATIQAIVFPNLEE